MRQDIVVINLIKNNNKVNFEFYQDGFLYYSVFCADLQDFLMFPVSIDNVGKGKLLNKAFKSDSASIFLKLMEMAFNEGLLVRKVY